MIRRDFLTAAGVTGVLASVQAGTLAAEATDSHHEPVAPDFDYTWIDKLTGKYRAVFDSIAVAEGASIFRANMWRNQYKQVYNTEPSDTNAVLVVRHHGFAMAMNNEYWEKYDVPNTLKITDDDGNPLKSNPADAAKGSNTIAAFVAAGGIVLGCNVAFGQVISAVRKKDSSLSRDDADKAARAYLIPGVILQPSGVFAVLRAQEAGCKYILAS